MQGAASTKDRSSQAGSHRLFFALWPDDATRLAIAAAAAQLRARSPGGRWIATDRYHLTVQFLGTFGKSPLSLIDAASTAAMNVRAPGFSLTLDRVGSFRTRSHLWWLGCARPDPLLPLREVLGRALEKHDRPADLALFTPHVTLVRRAGRPPPVDAALVPIVWPVTGFTLIHSESGAREPYRVVGHWPLPAP